MSRPLTARLARLLLCSPLLTFSAAADAAAQSGRTQSRSSRMSVELPTPVAETPVPFEDEGSGRRINTLSFTTPDAGFDRKVVRGAPFSAESLVEHVQTYADGNRSVRKSSARLYRDSAGRTRREHAVTREGSGVLAPDGQPPRLIFIADPVDEIEYRIDTRAQTVHRQEVPEAMRRMRERAMAGDGEGRFGVLMPTSTARRREAGEEGAPAPKPVREKLGRQSIDGVEAEGARTTVTIPAGEFDNERPFEITHEEWYSSDLKMIVMMRHVDPRFGETTFRLTNVSRGEQDRALFYPPDGYKVVRPARGPRGMPGRPLPPDMTPPHRRP
ncbi:MAG TPA: hypothetical protein VIP46_10165 [Pyrinomonadaceae bacterium]